MMVISITVEITVKEKTKLVMEFAAMAGFHVEKSHLNLIHLISHNASRMAATMDTLETVMANALIMKSNVMVSVKMTIRTAITMVSVYPIGGSNATIPVLMAGRGVGIASA